MTRDSIDRRAALGLFASASALAVLPGAAAATEAAPDAGLLALAQALLLRRAEYQKACDVEATLHAQYDAERPARPAALNARPFDLIGVEPCHSVRADGRYEHFYDGEAVDRLRTEPLTIPAGRARADEIIAAYEEWRAALEAFDARSGIGVAEQRAEGLGDDCAGLFEALIAIDAQTLRGLAAQAMAIEAAGIDEFSGDFIARIFEGVARLAARDAHSGSRS